MNKAEVENYLNKTCNDDTTAETFLLPDQPDWK